VPKSERGVARDPQPRARTGGSKNPQPRPEKADKNTPGRITHPEKVLFPDDGITKGELAAYYDAVADVMLPHLRGRPITMERFPSGIGAKGFLQKDVVKGFPEWLKRVEAPKKDGTVHYALADDRRSLLWLANQNTITMHVWPSRAPRIDTPDVCVFDLDPARDEPEVLRDATLALRDLLLEHGVTSWVKTSGSKGFHIVTRLKTGSTFGTSSNFADSVAAVLVQRKPKQLTLEFSKADRRGRIFVDTGRNRQGATFAAAYTVRAKPGAPVSAPCSWDEVERGEAQPQSFTLRSMAARLADVGDLWGDLVKLKR
jgi:bifunctional non-homologous end joining protein LigD